jgi:hypothetical protein
MSNYDYRMSADENIKKIIDDIVKVVNKSKNVRALELHVKPDEFEKQGGVLVHKPTDVKTQLSYIKHRGPGAMALEVAERLSDGFGKKRSSTSGMAPTVLLDPNVVIEEHPGVFPVSYMAYSNTVTMMHDVMEIMQLMNNCDDLPQWVDQCLSEAADRVAKAKRYIMGEKSKGSMPTVHDHAPSHAVAPACSCGCEACGAGTCHCPPDCACGCRAGEAEEFTVVDYSF